MLSILLGDADVSASLGFQHAVFPVNSLHHVSALRFEFRILSLGVKFLLSRQILRTALYFYLLLLRGCILQLSIYFRYSLGRTDNICRPIYAFLLASLLLYRKAR